MSGASGICPCCGYNLTADKPVEDGPFSYDPRQGFFVDGVRLNAEPRTHGLLGALMRLRGRFIALGVLAERMGYEGKRPEKMASMHLCLARKAVHGLGYHLPTETRYGVGVRWMLGSESAKQRASAL